LPLKLVKQFSTKTELVYQTLLEAILANELRPGTRLIVKEVAEQLQVSEIPVREALKLLEGTGLIETTPYVGAVVTTPSPEWIEEVFVLRAALESMAVRTAIPRMEEADRKHLMHLDSEIKQAARQGDVTEYSRLNRVFHRALIAQSPYPNLLKTIDDLLMKSQYGRAIFGLKPAAVKTSDAEHDELLRAVLERDAEAAAAITRNHRLRVGRELAATIREMGLDRQTAELPGQRESKGHA
jgi:DNA-binding GntR family transcriptional regulator